MTTTPDFDLLDDDGYPTEGALQHLRTFSGTAGQMAEYVQSLMDRGYAAFDYVTENGRPRKRLTLITGGWSGCEDVVAALADTMFQSLFWESSHRGGKHTFIIDGTQWDMNLAWGIPTKHTT